MSSSPGSIWVQIDTTERICIISMYILMTLVGGFGNVVSLICVYKQSRLEFASKKSHKILMSLIFSDTFASLCLCPTLAVSLVDVFSIELLTVLSSVLLLLTASSSLSIVLLSFERFLKLTKFQRYDGILTNRRLLILISGCWLGPGFIAGIGYFSPTAQSICYTILVIGTLVALLVFYTRIYRFTKRSQVHITANRVNTVRENNNTTEPTEPMGRLRRLTRKVMLLILTYFICSLPILFTALLLTFISFRSLRVLLHIAVVVYLGNSCVNPIIYVIRDKNFRIQVRNLLFGLRQNN